MRFIYILKVPGYGADLKGVSRSTSSHSTQFFQLDDFVFTILWLGKALKEMLLKKKKT